MRAKALVLSPPSEVTTWTTPIAPGLGDLGAGEPQRRPRLVSVGVGEYTYADGPKPACVMRILRDAAGAATELMIGEFNWEFPAAQIAELSPQSRRCETPSPWV